MKVRDGNDLKAFFEPESVAVFGSFSPSRLQRIRACSVMGGVDS